MPRIAKRMTPQGYIDRIVRRIAKKYHPDQIILFGSHARGEAGPDSDIDLLIVMPIPGSKLEAGLAIRRALGNLPIPFDLVLSTPEEFAWRKDVVGTIEWPAAREGKVVYDRTSGHHHGNSRVDRQGGE